MNHWASIVSELYQYVGMLRHYCRQGLPQWIYEELRSIQEVSHRYCDEQSPEDLVETLAQELAPHYNLPSDRLLDGSALLFDYDPDTIQVSRDFGILRLYSPALGAKREEVQECATDDLTMVFYSLPSDAGRYLFYSYQC